MDNSNDCLTEREIPNDCFSDSDLKIQVDEVNVLNQSLRRILSIDNEEPNPTKRPTRKKIKL